MNGQSLIGNLTWNADHTLATQNITDPFDSADTQNCSYTHDDLSRLASVNCGAIWSQTFTYDAFGNVSKSGTYTFQPIYKDASGNTSNRFVSIPGTTVSYDANGNVLSDGTHTYTWDSDGKSLSADAVNLAYDALGRMVEQNRSGSYTQIVYSPAGGKLALMNGQTLQKGLVALPGGGQAVYNSSGLQYYGHSDHLGSIKLGSTPSRTMSFDLAYAPFGETYATSGTIDPSFTGQRQDTVAGLFDFPARQYSTQGRWPTPDPSGLASVGLSDPQTLNRYAYVRNNPLTMVDPNGLCGEEDDEACSDSEGPDGGGNIGMGGGGGGIGNDPTSGGAIDDSGSSCFAGSATCGGFVDSPLVDQTSGSSFTTFGWDSNSDFYASNLSLPDLSSLTSLDTSTYQDQQLQALAPGILQGAGSIGDPSTYAIWFGAAALAGAASSAGALYELGQGGWEVFGSNMITWQTGGLYVGETADAGFAEAFDIISNGLNRFSVTGTGNGAVMGAMINMLIDPPAYDPPWKGIPYPSPSGGHR